MSENLRANVYVARFCCVCCWHPLVRSCFPLSGRGSREPRGPVPFDELGPLCIQYSVALVRASLKIEKLKNCSMSGTVRRLLILPGAPEDIAPHRRLWCLRAFVMMPTSEEGALTRFCDTRTHALAPLLAPQTKIASSTHHHSSEKLSNFRCSSAKIPGPFSLVIGGLVR